MRERGKLRWWIVAVAVVIILLLQPPARAAETDSAVLIDNFALKVNGAPINPNFDFETGTLDGFTRGGDVRVVNNVGSIGSPDGSAHFALLTTGVGALGNSHPYVFDFSFLRQIFSINPGDEVAVSSCYNFLTNEPDRLHPASDRAQMVLPGANVSSLLWNAWAVKLTALKDAPLDSGWLYETGWQCLQDIPLTRLLLEQGLASSTVSVNVFEVVRLPTIELRLNQTSFRPGETLMVTATVNHDGPLSLDFDAEVYVRIPPPSPGAKQIHLNVFEISDVRISPGMSFSGEIFKYTFKGSEPPGNYSIIGTLYSSIGNWFTFDSDSRSFGFSTGSLASGEGQPLGIELPFVLEIGP